MNREDPDDLDGGQAHRSQEHEELVIRAYAAYSRQDLDCLLSLVTDDVDWPGGVGQLRRLHGHEQLRAFWTRQWQTSRTTDVPVRVDHEGPGVVGVDVEQVVRTPDGFPVSRGTFRHILHLRGGRIRRLDITAGGGGF